MANMRSEGRSSRRLSDLPPQLALGPAVGVAKLTKTDVPLERAARMLWVGQEGSSNIIDLEGNQHDAFPLFEGLNQIGILALLPGGTVDDVWAVY